MRANNQKGLSMGNNVEVLGRLDIALPDHQELVRRLAGLGQEHVYAFYDRLSAAEKLNLDRQVASIDWPLVRRLIDTVVLHPQPFSFPENILPAPYFENKPHAPDRQKKYQLARRRGEELLRMGKVAAFVVAGGQSSRLGWDGPKGIFPATPVRHKPLFQYFAEFLLAMQKRFDCTIPFYIMTSTVNHAATTAFWKKHGHFGLSEKQLMFFPQDMLPAVSFAGKVLLESPGSLALSPNGHGGSLLALYKSGAVADMAGRGIEQISYFQVDNPIVRCVDPLFIGLHVLENADMSCKMLPKAFGKEKLGNFCLRNGKLTVIEYSDMPDSLAEQRLADGQLRFRLGSIALHVLRRDFVERLNRNGLALSYHRAEKKVPYVDPSGGKQVKPEKPNAVKMEMFVCDALPWARHGVVYETDRVDEFAPIKQLEGIDSLVTSHQITTQRNAAWLEAAGATIPRKPDGTPDCMLEIAPSFALYAEDVAAKKLRLAPIPPGGAVYLA